MGLIVKGKNIFEYNCKCRVSATYRPTSIDINNRTGVCTIIIIIIICCNITTSSDPQGPI